MSLPLDIERFAASPCSTPELGYEEVLAAYSAMGYRKFELFTSWTKSAADYHGDARACAATAARHGMKLVSMHLPPVKDDRKESLAEAIAAAKFASALGVRVVLYKATSRPNYIAGARPFLDAIEGLGLTPVLQNHFGTPISTLADFQEVIDGIADGRMKTLLEVGHFHSAGVKWPDGYRLLGSSIALVHIKDQIGAKPVPFGQGEIDLAGLFRRLETDSYAGDIVVEMEAAPGDTARSLALLDEGRRYIVGLLQDIHRT